MVRQLKSRGVTAAKSIDSDWTMLEKTNSWMTVMGHWVKPNLKNLHGGDLCLDPPIPPGEYTPTSPAHSGFAPTSPTGLLAPPLQEQTHTPTLPRHLKWPHHRRVRSYIPHKYQYQYHSLCHHLQPQDGHAHSHRVLQSLARNQWSRHQSDGTTSSQRQDVGIGSLIVQQIGCHKPSRHIHDAEKR